MEKQKNFKEEKKLKFTHNFVTLEGLKEKSALLKI